MKTFILRSMCFTAALLCAVLQINAQSVEDFISVEEGLSISIQNDETYPWIVNEDGVLVSNMHEPRGKTSITFTNNSKECAYCDFGWKVSSEHGCDLLKLYGPFGTMEISGYEEYQQCYILIAPNESVTFEYSKDGSVNSYDDCGYVSNLIFTKLNDTDSSHEWVIFTNNDGGDFNHTATIIKYHDPDYSVDHTEPRSLSIPATITRKGITFEITAIDKRIFENYPHIYNVDIPETVTSIEDYAFQNCRDLISISLPNSVTKIGNYAFAGCM